MKLRSSRHSLSLREEMRSSYSKKFDMNEIKEERAENKKKRNKLKMPANMNYSF